MSNQESLHQALQSALAAGDFDAAQQLSVELGEAIIGTAAAAEAATRAAILKEGLGRLQEHLSLARVMRAHLASQLQNNTAAFLYQYDSSGGEHSWRFSA
jgi:hypothetical protein